MFHVELRDFARVECGKKRPFGRKGEAFEFDTGDEKLRV
jgi:hypothetical protein